MLIGNLYHEHLTVQTEVRAGHGQGGAPLPRAGFRGNAFQTLFFGIVGLGNGGVQLVAAAGVVAFKLVIDFGGRLQVLFQIVRPYQRRRPEGLILIMYFMGNVDICRCIVQFLLRQFLA